MILSYYYYFYQVAICGNITQAAKKLFMSQPALSKAIVNMEGIVGYPLFRRLPKGVELTPEGEVMLTHVRKTYELLHDAREQISNMHIENVEEIKIALGGDLFKIYISRVLPEFMDKHPEIHVSVQCMFTPQVTEKILQSELDLGVTTALYDNKELDSHPVMLLKDCFVVGKRLRHLVNDVHNIYDMLTYPFIMLPSTSFTKQNFDHFFDRYHLHVEPRYVMSSTDLISKAAADGWGIGCVTEEFVEDDIREGKLFKLQLDEMLPERHATLIWRKDISSSAVRILLEYLIQDYLRQRDSRTDNSGSHGSAVRPGM